MSQLLRGLRWTVGLLLVLLALLALAYWLFPRLVQGPATRLLAAHDVELLQLAVARPSSTNIVIEQLKVSSGGYEIRASDVDLSYALAELWHGRLTAVTIAQLTVTRLPAETQGSETSGSWAASLPARLDPAYWLAQLPWRTLAVQQLGFSDPQGQLQLSGRIRQDRRSLEAELAAMAPQTFVGQRFTLSYTPGAGLQLAMTDSAGAEPVRITSRFGPAVMDLHLEANIEGLLAQLLAVSLAAPELDFQARLSARSRVPWPLPRDFGMQSVTVLGQLDLDLAPAPDLSMSGVGGLFTLQAGELAWTLDSGRMAWVDAASATRLNCQLAEPLLARLDRVRLELSDGLRCNVRNDADVLELGLNSLEYQWPQSDATAAGTLAFYLGFDGAMTTIGPVAGDLRMTASAGSVERLEGRGVLGLRTALLAGSDEAQQHPIPVRLHYWPASEQGELQFDLQVPLAQRLLGSMGLAESGEADIGAGQLRGNASINWQPEGFALAMDGSLQGLLLNLGSELPTLRPLDGTFEVALKGALLTASSALVVAGVSVPLQINADLDAGSGSARSEYVVQVQDALLKNLTTDWQQPFDLLGGQLSGWTEARWQAGADAQVRGLARLTDASGYFDDYLAGGMSGDLHFTHDAERTEATLKPLQIARLDVGFPVTAITAELGVNSTGEGVWLELGAGSAAVLGGQAGIARAQINLTDSSGEFPVTLSGLSLADTLALEGEDISGTGVLDGQLPVRFSPGGLVVVGGQVRARPPGGVIRVGEDFTTPTGQPGLDFAVQALADFQYSALDATVDYAEDGELLLGVKLRGHNPAVEQGRAIHYNVNITENVPSLLESLQADARLTERIQNKVERKVNR